MFQNIGIARICDGLAAQSHGVGLKSLNIAHNHFNAAITSGIAAALVRHFLHTPSLILAASDMSGKSSCNFVLGSE